MTKAFKWLKDWEKAAAALFVLSTIIGFIAVGAVYPFKVKQGFSDAGSARAEIIKDTKKEQEIILEKVAANKKCCEEIEEELDTKVTEPLVMDKIEPLKTGINFIVEEMKSMKQAQENDSKEIKRLIRDVIKASGK